MRMCMWSVYVCMSCVCVMCCVSKGATTVRVMEMCMWSLCVCMCICVYVLRVLDVLCVKGHNKGRVHGDVYVVFVCVYVLCVCVVCT